MPLKEHWQRLHHRPRWVRWPLKAGFLLVVVALTLYPKVWLIPAWVQRLANLNSVLDPQHPGLASFQEDVTAAVGGSASLVDAAEPVEHVVCRRIPYAYDWETWGVMDYLPTVDEVLAAGREDCDGRAVIAASLLRRMGFEAWLVTDLKHTWVVARDDRGAEPVEIELMSPGAGERTLTGDETGTRTMLNLATIRNLARSLTFGVAVFPLVRELIIFAALCAILVHPWSPLWRRIAGCGVLLLALATLRAAGESAQTLAATPPLVWTGVALLVAGCVTLAVRRREPGDTTAHKP